jgi:hypothetical protein
MPDQLATCPNCGHEFEVADVLTDSIREELRRELEGEIVKKQEEVKKRLDEARQLEKSLAEREESIENAVSEKLQAEKKKVAAAERKRPEQEIKGQLDDLRSSWQSGRRILKRPTSANRSCSSGSGRWRRRSRACQCAR